jgi:serralysin
VPVKTDDSNYFFDEALAMVFETVRSLTGRAFPSPLALTRAAVMGVVALTMALIAAPSHAAGYTCVNNYYVDAANGNDSNPGSYAAPWKTINHSVWDRLAGDCVNVRPGIYTEVVWAQMTPGQGASNEKGYFVLRSLTPGGARIFAPLNANVYNVVNILGSYTIVEGFEVNGQVGTGGAGGACISAEQQVALAGGQFRGIDHIRIMNNIVHDCGGSGIALSYGDIYQVNGNVAYNNASTNGYQTSGISIFEPTYNPAAANGDDQYLQWRIDVTNNYSYNNIETNTAAPAGQHTDGNGIILDTFNNYTRSGPNYTAPSHVGYNVVFGNGGKGIQIAWSNNVTVDHNSAFGNNLDLGNSGTWRGEINNQNGNGNTIINNIAYTVPTTTNVRKYNTAYLSESTATGGNIGLVFTSNVSFNGTAGAASLSASMPSAVFSSSNRLGVNPQFVSIATSNVNLFLEPTSPVYYKDIGFQ